MACSSGARGVGDAGVGGAGGSGGLAADASADSGGASCADLDAYCADHRCPAWGDGSLLCAEGINAVQLDCSGYNLAIIDHVSQGTSFYYDDSGMLAAVVVYRWDEHFCIAARPGFVEPDCSKIIPEQPCALEAGTDAGRCSFSMGDYCKLQPCPSFSDTGGLCASSVTGVEDCGGYHVGIVQGNTSRLRYYFASDGTLVDVDGCDVAGPPCTCIAGSDTFVEPDCSGAQPTPICAADAGTD